MNKTKGPGHYETISPATKLLEKRRKMYEIHEQFDDQKDEFKRYFLILGLKEMILIEA